MWELRVLLENLMLKRQRVAGSDSQEEIEMLLSVSRTCFAVLFAGLFLIQSGEAVAVGYQFNIKVINNSGQDLEISWVKWRPRGSSEGLSINETCSVADDTIIPAGEYIMPSCRANRQKWQRQIKLGFTCKTSGTHRAGLNFPRGSKKFFARNHAADNGDKYVVKVKAGDC